MKRIALILALLFAPTLAFGQSTATPVVTGYLTTSGCPTGQTVCFVQYGSGGGAPPSNVTTIPLGATSTQIGSTVTTHLTFQSALAAAAGRRGCLFVNTSADKMWVYFGATGSATTSNAIPLPAGQNVSCNAGGIVLTDNVAVTSNATDGATYVVVSQ